MPAHDSRIRLRARLAISLLSLSAGTCYKLDDNDCQTYGSCDQALLEAYRKEAPRGCATCLQRNKACRTAFKMCSDDPACTPAALCQLRPDRITYQDCLSGLLHAELSTPDDPRGAWEGQTQLIQDCLNNAPCLTACKRHVSDWSCVGEEPYETPTQLVDFTFTFSVTIFNPFPNPGEPTYKPIADVSIRQCAEFTCGEDKEPGVTTREDGTIELRVGRPSPNGLYFELTDTQEIPRFPRTLYYPGRIGKLKLQPLAIYLIPTDIVRAANEGLIKRGEVLMDAGQTLILPDACREQDAPSATDATLRARSGGQLVEQCWAAEVRADGSRPACVWYANRGGSPNPDRQRLDGFGGGVVGLPPTRKNTFYVCDGTTVVSRLQDVEIAGGTLTIMRMSPLTAAEKMMVAQEERTLGNPCESQLSSSSTSDASAN
jgi:hypothetical protein